VPYLDIYRCPEVTNFSCLGSQRCLEVIGCPNLLDESISRYGNISCLRVEYCSGLTQIAACENNLFLKIKKCDNLRKVCLAGRKYVEVNITHCESLVTLEIPGYVYVLKLKELPPNAFPAPSNCTYLEK
jgi:hypothetical protein